MPTSPAPTKSHEQRNSYIKITSKLTDTETSLMGFTLVRSSAMTLQHLRVHSLVSGESKHPKMHQQYMQTYSTELLTNHMVFIKTSLNVLKTRNFTTVHKIVHFLAKINHLTRGGFNKPGIKPRLCMCTRASQQQNGFKMQQQETTIHQLLESPKCSTTVSL